MSRSLGPAFRRLFAASASSNLADGATRVALPLLAASLTRDPVLVAALTSLSFLPWLLFGLPAGAVVDRVDRKRAMAAANTVRAVAVGALAVTALTGTASLVVLYVVAFAKSPGCAAARPPASAGRSRVTHPSGLAGLPSPGRPCAT